MDNLISTDDFEAKVTIAPDGTVKERGVVLLVDTDFYGRDITEKVRLIKDARKRIMAERFGRRQNR
jgi:hypothetical protein